MRPESLDIGTGDDRRVPPLMKMAEAYSQYYDPETTTDGFIIGMPNPPPVISIRLLSEEAIAADPEMSEDNHFVERIVNSQTPSAFFFTPVYTDDVVAAEPGQKLPILLLDIPRHELDDYIVSLYDGGSAPQQLILLCWIMKIYLYLVASGETEITEGASATFTITTGGEGSKQALLERNAYAFTRVETSSSGACRECDWEDAQNAELADDFTSDTGVVARLLTLEAEPPANTRGSFNFAVADDLIYDPDEYFWIDICGFIASK